MTVPPRTALRTLLDGDAIATALACEFLIGARHLLENSAPPRVVAVPLRASYPDAIQGASTGVKQQKNWRSSLGVYDLHLWGEDFDGCREMERKLVAHLLKYRSAMCRIEAGEWLVTRPEWIRDGEVFVLRVSIKEPLVDDAATQATIATVAFDNTTTTNGDGRVDAGES